MKQPNKPPLQSFVWRYLDPADSLTEVLFGVIMTLAITLGAGLVVKEGDQAATRLLLGILGCNLAWGFVDAVMYLMGCILERTTSERMLLAIQKSGDENDALAVIQRELDPKLERLTSNEERSQLYHDVLARLRSLPAEHTRVRREDLYGAVAIWLLVSLPAIPALLPFIVVHDRFLALRASNVLQLSALFLTGYHWARVTHMNPWRFGMALLLVGMAMVVVVTAFGG